MAKQYMLNAYNFHLFNILKRSAMEKKPTTAAVTVPNNNGTIPIFICSILPVFNFRRTTPMMAGIERRKE